MVVLVVMGVSGSGKSTVARMLADRLGCRFAEGDDLHPAENVAKMRAGVPLNDDDRRPWLDRVAAWITERVAAREDGVVTCSALKRAYRERLARGGGVVFVYLAVDRARLEKRLADRRGHYMPAGLLDSQLATLEEPGTDEPAVRVYADAPPDAVVDEVLARLAAQPGIPHGG